MFFQDGLTGSAWGDWANYTDSPLRAEAAPDFSKECRQASSSKLACFQALPSVTYCMSYVNARDLRVMPVKELGALPPLGYWDPLGFSKFENPEAW